MRPPGFYKKEAYRYLIESAAIAALAVSGTLEMVYGIYVPGLDDIVWILLLVSMFYGYKITMDRMRGKEDVYIGGNRQYISMFSMIECVVLVALLFLDITLPGMVVMVLYAALMAAAIAQAIYLLWLLFRKRLKKLFDSLKDKKGARQLSSERA